MSISMKRNIRPNKKSYFNKIINSIIEILKMKGNGSVRTLLVKKFNQIGILFYRAFIEYLLCAGGRGPELNKDFIKKSMSSSISAIIWMLLSNVLYYYILEAVLLQLPKKLNLRLIQVQVVDWGGGLSRGVEKRRERERSP